MALNQILAGKCEITPVGMAFNQILADKCEITSPGWYGNVSNPGR